MSVTSENQSAKDLERLDLALTRLRRLWESPAVKRRFIQLLGAPAELSTIRALRAIERAGEEPSVGDVADLLCVDTSTASRFVDQAVLAGYVSRGTAPHDRRRTVLTHTSLGEQVLEQVKRTRRVLLEELTGDWSIDEVATLALLLDRLAGSVDALERRT